MGYEPTEWKAGDTVTSAKLNKIEQGIKNSVLVANFIQDDLENNIAPHLDKTWQEIYDADFCIANITEEDGTIVTCFVGVKSPGRTGKIALDYAVILFYPGATDQLILKAATPNDYPEQTALDPDPGPGSEEAN